MPKKGKKTGKKSAAKRPTTQEKRQEKVQQTVNKDDRLSLNPETGHWRAVIPLLLIALLVGLYWATKPENCGFVSKLEPLWTLLQNYGLSQRPTDAVVAHTCERIHSVTQSCLFLSGATHNPSGTAHGGFMGLWNHTKVFFGKTAGSSFSSMPETLYKRDVKDVLFAVTWGVILLALREVLMHVLLLPTARALVKTPPQEKLNSPRHLKKYQRSIDRFAEQFWIVILYSTSLVLVVVSVCFD